MKTASIQNANQTTIEISLPHVKQTIRRLMQHACEHWQIFTFGLLATILVALCDATSTWIVKPLIDHGLIKHRTVTAHRMAIWFGILAILRAFSGFLADYCVYRSGRNIVMSLRSTLFKHLHDIAISHHDQQTNASMLTNMIYNIEQIAIACTDAFIAVLRDGLTIITLIILMLSIHWQLALMFLSSLPIVALITSLSSKRSRAINQEVQSSMALVTEQTQEALFAQKTIRMLDMFSDQSHRFNDALKHNRAQELKVIIAHSTASALSQLALAMPIAVAFIWISQQHHGITMGSFVAILLAALRVIQPLKRLSRVNAAVQRGLASAESIFALLDIPSLDNQGAHQSLIQGNITFENISFTYASRTKPSLQNISIDIKAGEKIAIIGHSGSGKSTLIELLLNFYQPDVGRIKIDGIDLKAWEIKHLREQIAIISQDVFLFNGTIADNISAFHAHSKQTIIDAATQAHAHDFIMALPHGYDTTIGDNGALLSGGQKQRLAIARALIKKAKIVIFDEATSALDHATQAQVIQTIQEALNHCTIMMITHHKQTIQWMDRCITLSEGNIINQATIS